MVIGGSGSAGKRLETAEFWKGSKQPISAGKAKEEVRYGR
jgi:hypothetical protein